MNLDVTAQKISQQALTIKSQNPTENQLLTFIGNNTSAPPNVAISGRGEAANFAMAAAAEPAPAEKGQSYLDRWKNEIHKAVCVDFNYCARKATVDADINKYLPDIVKALIGNKVGSSGPSWFAAILGTLGFTAGWEAAVATVVAYLLIKGLGWYCGC